MCVIAASAGRWGMGERELCGVSRVMCVRAELAFCKFCFDFLRNFTIFFGISRLDASFG